MIDYDKLLDKIEEIQAKAYSENFGTNEEQLQVRTDVIEHLKTLVNNSVVLDGVSVSDADIDHKYNIAGCMSSEKALMEIIYNANKEGARWMRGKLIVSSR